MVGNNLIYNEFIRSLQVSMRNKQFCHQQLKEGRFDDLREKYFFTFVTQKAAKN